MKYSNNTLWLKVWPRKHLADEMDRRLLIQLSYLIFRRDPQITADPAATRESKKKGHLRLRHADSAINVLQMTRTGGW